MTEQSTEERDRLLLAILGNVPFDGWTAKALAHADPSGVETRRLFPGGVSDALRHFADWADRQMSAAMDGVELGEFRIRDQIALLVKARLDALEPHKEAVRREAGWLALHAPELAPKLLWRTADSMWRLAGDTASDLNHYSKRVLLSGVIATTTLCWLGDSSPGNEATWAFLDRRIDNVLVWGKRAGMAAKFADPARLLEMAAGMAARLRYR